jgi:hypothetical protein
VFNLLQQLQALGLDIPTVLQQLGIQTNGGSAPPAMPDTGAEAEAGPATKSKKT